MQSADGNRAGTGHTEHFADLHGAGADRAIASVATTSKSLDSTGRLATMP